MSILHRTILALAIFGLIAATTGEAQADPTNFSYSTLSVGVGKITLKNQTCILTECYKELGQINLGGAYQFADDWLVVSLNVQGAGNSGPNTSISSGGSSLGLNIVKALGDRVDIMAGVAALSVKNESCLGSLCATSDDNGSAVGAGVSVWFDSNHMFAGHLAVASSKYSKSSQSTTTTGIGASFYPGKAHEISLSFSGNDTATTSNLGYAYHF